MLAAGLPQRCGGSASKQSGAAHLARSSVPAPTPTPDETWREQTVDLAVAGGGSLHCAAPAPVWNGSALAYPATIVRYGSSVAAWQRAARMRSAECARCARTASPPSR